VWKAIDKVEEGKSVDSSLAPIINGTVRKVTSDLENLKFNTAISAMMILVNQYDKKVKISKKGFETLLILLSPFAPHIAEELWQRLGHVSSIFLAPWPKGDSTKTLLEITNIAVQVNGKVRAIIAVTPGMTEDDVKGQARESKQVKAYTEGKTVKKVIYVPGKILSIVV